jgi:TatD DNase family protein
MRWIDTHCHLDAAEFDGDRSAVLARAQAAGVGLQVLPAVMAANFDTVRQLAHDHGLAYALGIHPLCTPLAGEADLALLAQALVRHRDDPRLVAVGEIGLDGLVPGLDWARQEHFYNAQLKLAQAHGLPVILHVRRSADALLKGLRRLPVAGGIAHAFNGSQVQAQAFIARGFALGFGGTVTFERALQIRRLAQALPDTALVLETDAPDIPPQWLYRTQAQRRAAPAESPEGRGAEARTVDPDAAPVVGVPGPQARNEPAELPRIAETLAELRGWTLAQTATTTSTNALRVLPRLVGLWS